MKSKDNFQIFGFSIDEISKLLAGSVFISYVFGYLILAFSFRTYGFSQSNPLRPRVLETGVIFIALSIIPLALGIAVGLIGSRSLSNRAILPLKLVAIAPLCEMFMNLPAIGFDNDRLKGTILILHYAHNRKLLIMWFIILAISSTAALIAAASWIWRHYDRRLKLCILIFSFLSLAIFVAHVITWATDRSHYFIWTFVFTMIGVLIASGARNSSETRSSSKFSSVADESHASVKQLPRYPRIRDFHVPLVISSPAFAAIDLAFAILVYSHMIFPALPYSLGGGETHMVRVHMKSTQKNDESRMNLLDENEQGFFLSEEVSGSVMFVPREQIEVIHYDGKESGKKQATK